MFTGSGTGSVPAFPRRRFWQMPSAIAAGVPSCGQAPPNPTGGTSATEIEWPGSVSAGFTRFRWTLWNIGPVVTGPMFHRADGGAVGGRHGGGGVARGTGAAVGLGLWDIRPNPNRRRYQTLPFQPL